MHRFVTALLLVANLTGHIFGQSLGDGHCPVLGRTSLGFGPVHPHAAFFPSPNHILINGPETDPIEVARRFVWEVVGNHSTIKNSFKIRKDSYMDAATGVTHVYARQYVNGLEVADGDININVKDGVVLSFGNSFYIGPTDTLSETPEDHIRHPHREYCDDLSGKLQDHYKVLPHSQGGQGVMERVSSLPGITDPLSRLYSTNCRFQSLPYDLASSRKAYSDNLDFKSALLQFMVAATPNEHDAQDILSNFDTHFDRMSATEASDFGPSDDQETMSFYISNVPGAINPVKAYLAYSQVPNKRGDSTDLNLVWKFEIEMLHNWYETAVSATAPHRIISVIDWASDAPIPLPPSHGPATYNVFAWGLNDPSEGNRSINKENFDALASPVGWHALPFKNDPQFQGVRLVPTPFYRHTTTTWGNNVLAQENWMATNEWIDNHRPDAGASKSFEYKYDGTPSMAEARKHINATVTQLFYTANMVHDLYYRYGFDEVAGNFQQYNFDHGGEENDAIITDAQDSCYFGFGYFVAPPDGRHGRCLISLWIMKPPIRDGVFDAGILIHELSHGLSMRLTGGPANSGCLPQGGESGGMGEGWSDFLATIIRSTNIYSDYPIGAWAENKAGGSRKYLYSLDKKVNPTTYETLDGLGYSTPHAIGEVWAEILWVVSHRLINKHGFVNNLFPPAPLANGTIPEGDFYRPAEYTPDGKQKPLIPKHGNSLSVQLVLNGMKLQPCRPSFFEARDAIIQADRLLTGGENYCSLWEGFAARGLGLDASRCVGAPGGGKRTNGFQVPLVCEKENLDTSSV